MADNESSQRPVRKLTVKNFSVIKDAELEFGKITVLIGPQASGKSLLCELAYFLGTEVISIAVSRIQVDGNLSALEDAVKREFEKWFPRTGWGRNAWNITFNSEGYALEISSDGKLEGRLSLSWGGKLGLYISQSASKFLDYLTAARDLKDLGGRGTWDRITYIPSERAYFVDTGKAFRYLASDPTPLARAFALLFESSRSLEIPKPRTQRYLKGSLIRGEDAWQFAFDDGRILPLSHLSSGNKELLPLLSVLEMYEFQRPSSVLASDNREINNSPSWLSFDDFFIEEPESHVFPDMQQTLARYFAELANSRQLRLHFTITTHSPYILTAFNTLIKANQAAKASPSRAAEVAQIVLEKYWIDERDFRAYAMDGSSGVLKPIMDSETGLIDGDYLDDVSSEIANEFGQLLELQYGG